MEQLRDIIVGLLIGVGIMMVFIIYKYKPHQLMVINAIEVCESKLPRDQNCVITAVIEESGE